MPISKQTIISWIKLLALFFGASIIQSFFMCARCSTLLSYLRVVSFTFCLWLLLFQGHSILATFLSSRISWLEFPLKRFFVGLVSTIVYTLMVVLFLVFVFQTYLGFNFGSSIRFTVYTSALFTLIISLFLHSREFLMHWRRAALETSRLQRERIASRYESLKSRVNPQLLYNSLQSLAKLVPVNKDHAVRFIKHLSEVYRYILDTREKEIVSYEEEVKFLRSFAFLLESRFGSGIRLTINRADSTFLVSPLSIQLIIESLCSGCKFDESSPLHITVESVDLHIGIVVPELEWNDEPDREKVFSVVQNVVDQYLILTDKPVTYEKAETMFRCRIPMITEGNEQLNDQLMVSGTV